MVRLFISFVQYKIRKAIADAEARTREQGYDLLDSAIQRNRRITIQPKRKARGKLTITGTGGRP